MKTREVYSSVASFLNLSKKIFELLTQGLVVAVDGFYLRYIRFLQSKMV